MSCELNVRIKMEALIANAATDFCYSCDKETAWNGEVCTVCSRIWGYERDFCECSESDRRRGEHTPGCLAYDGERVVVAP